MFSSDSIMKSLDLFVKSDVFKSFFIMSLNSKFLFLNATADFLLNNFRFFDGNHSTLNCDLKMANNFHNSLIKKVYEKKMVEKQGKA